MTSTHSCGAKRLHRLRGLLLTALLLAPAVPLAPLGLAPAQAQEQGAQQPFSTLRAVNLARMRAESINGGLIVYRAQRCMFEDNGGPCLISRDANGLLFRFLGGPPGWQEQNQPPTLETEILISPDGRQVLNVVYNGKPRPTN
ncbi:MAG: hypothetical protein WCQ20_07210 [Synechococcaceae cyanobacterium ELA739]